MSKKTRYTPGPWEAADTLVTWPESTFRPTPQHPRFIVAQCSTFCGQGVGTLPYKEACANAALFAAAPDLLAACEQVLIASEDDGDMNDIDWKGLRKAVKKARRSR